MSKLKTSSASSETAFLAEKEFLLDRQQTEMKAGEALVREASQKIADQIADQKETIKAEDRDTKEYQPEDTAQLSDLYLRLHRETIGSVEEIPEWVLELAEKDWEVFLEWQPEADVFLQLQLQELSGLYLRLLEAAFTYAEGENLAVQMERLDALLVQKLRLVMEENLEQLMIMLENTGETAVLEGICANLYRQTAGRTLSAKAVHRLFMQTVSPVRQESFSGKGMESRTFSGEGMIYQSSRKQNIRFQQVYHGQKNSWKEQIRQRTKVISDARKGIAANTFRQAGSVSCTGKELERANRFAAHINGSGNLFHHPELSAGNEEVTGLLAAIMTIKGYVYAGDIEQKNSLILSFQRAIGKIVDHYLSQKGVTNVYYYTLSAYRQTRNPQKAIQTGQDYAYQQFHEKQKDPAYQRNRSYSRESGFFRAFLKNMSPEKELALGSSILRKDWENFLRITGKPAKSSYSSRAEKYSPWGILFDPGVQHTSSKNMANVLLSIAIVIVIVVLAIVFFFA